MQLIKPAFVHHEGQPIFSCDIHPDGIRFATAGFGKFSGRISIWNLHPVISEIVDKDENIPKLLCNLENQMSCVNSVRWSYNGKWLASGSNDKVVMIWVRSGEARLNDAGIPIGMEQWRCIHTLSAHDSDVMDVAWSPRDTLLASCSVDNNVIIWNMEGRPAMLVRLAGHEGLVKGLAWDPVGEFLASQSDDHSVKLWRTSDWKLQATITKPFENSGDVTQVLRLHWSPDGQYIVTAHATNNGGPTAQIIERPMDAEKKNWSCYMDFVGHRKAVTCVKFNSNLLKKPLNDGDNKKFCVLATGSRDCSIAVWSTIQKRPLLVVKNVFTQSAVDMSWTTDGTLFMACSAEGTVAFFHFKESELGTVVSPDEKMLALENLYGKRLLHGKVEPVVEVPEMMLIDEPVPAPANLPAPPEKEEKKEAPPAEPVTVVTVKQIEFRGKDGKRRITPISVPRDAPLPSQAFSSSIKTKTKIVVEEVKETANLSSTPTTATTQAELPTPPKHKRMSLMPSDVSTPRAISVIDPKMRQELRTASSPVIKALGNDGGSCTPVTGALGSYVIVENAKDPPLVKVRREVRGTPPVIQWEFVVAHNIVGVKCNTTTTILACNDRSVHVLDSSSGSPKSLPLLLPGQVACMDLTMKDQLCVVTVCGHVATWDFSKGRRIMQDVSLRSELQTEGVAFASCKMKDDGTPIVILTNGRSFLFSESMGWQLLTDTKTALWQLANQKDAVACLPPAEGSLTLRGLLRDLHFASAGSQVRVGAVAPSTVATCSATRLQHQLLAADAIGSSAEVKSLLLSMVRLLAQSGAVTQIRTLLLGHAQPRNLMPDCLSVLKEFVHCQRLYVELSTPACALINDESLGPPPVSDSPQVEEEKETPMTTDS